MMNEWSRELIRDAAREYAEHTGISANGFLDGILWALHHYSLTKITAEDREWFKENR